MPLCCVRQPDGECEGRNTVILATLQHVDDDAPVFVARFQNHGKWSHAEKVMMQDKALMDSIDAVSSRGKDVTNSHVAKGSRVGSVCRAESESSAKSASRAEFCDDDSNAKLSAYISLQPCHHSSSTRDISCTTDLFDWFVRELQPRRVSFDLIIAYPYRSHWRSSNMSREEMIELGARSLWGPRFHSKGNSSDRDAVAQAVQEISDDAQEKSLARAEELMRAARAGTCLLCSNSPNGFNVRSFQTQDWLLVTSYCDASVRDAWKRLEFPFTLERQNLRKLTDAWVGMLLDSYRSGRSSPSLPPHVSLASMSACQPCLV